MKSSVSYPVPSASSASHPTFNLPDLQNTAPASDSTSATHVPLQYFLSSASSLPSDIAWEKNKMWSSNFSPKSYWSWLNMSMSMSLWRFSSPLLSIRLLLRHTSLSFFFRKKRLRMIFALLLFVFIFHLTWRTLDLRKNISTYVNIQSLADLNHTVNDFFFMYNKSSISPMIPQASLPDGGSRRKCHVAMISTYPPEHCGIAEFAKNLIDALILAEIQKTSKLVLSSFSSHEQDKLQLDEDCTFSVIAYHDDRLATFFRNYDYSLVSYIIDLDDELPSKAIYDAALYISSNGFTHVIMHQEFGLTPKCWQQVDLVRWLSPSIQIMSIIHSPRAHPTVEERGNLRQIARSSKWLVVMSWYAKFSLIDAYGVEEDKIHVIPHGVTESVLLSQRPILSHPNIPNKKVSIDHPEVISEAPFIILSNGLIHMHKGYDRMIRLLPKLLLFFPNVQFLVIGREHTSNKESKIMNSLLEFAQSLNVADHISWVNRYVTEAELIQYFHDTDVYVTMYDEITPVSGTLTIAMAAGLPIISTPYRYAQEMLSNGRGCVLQGFDADEDAILTFIKVLSSHELRKELGQRAKEAVKKWKWNSVARRYIDILQNKVPPSKYKYSDLPTRPDEEDLLSEDAFVADLQDPSHDDIFPNPWEAVGGKEANEASWIGRTVKSFDNQILMSPELLLAPLSAPLLFKSLVIMSAKILARSDQDSDSTPSDAGTADVSDSYEGASSLIKKWISGSSDRTTKPVLSFPGSKAETIVVNLLSDDDIQVNGVLEEDFRLSAIGVRTLDGWILAHELYGLDYERRPTSYQQKMGGKCQSGREDRPFAPSPSYQADRPQLLLQFSKGLAVIPARHGTVTLKILPGEGVAVIFTQWSRFAHPMGLLGETLQRKYDVSFSVVPTYAIDPNSFTPSYHVPSTIKTKPRASSLSSASDSVSDSHLGNNADWSGWIIADGFLFSIHSKNQTWTRKEIRLNVFYVKEAQDFLRHHLNYYPLYIPAASFMAGLSRDGQEKVKLAFRSRNEDKLRADACSYMQDKKPLVDVSKDKNGTLQRNSFLFNNAEEESMIRDTLNILPFILTGASGPASLATDEISASYRPVILFQMEGPFFDHQGFSTVNRQLWLSLQESPLHIFIRVKPTDLEAAAIHTFKADSVLKILLYDAYRKPYKSLMENEASLSDKELEEIVFAAKPPRIWNGWTSFITKKDSQAEWITSATPPDVVFRNAWLSTGPDFSLPIWPHTRWIHQQPWEFHGVPVSWMMPLNNATDALLVPSYYCRDSYLDNGIDPSLLYVLRHGVSFHKYQWVTGTLQLPTRKSFKILFAGGLLHRKGVDIMLEAYKKAFKRSDDVTLIIHSVYGDGYYLDEIKRAIEEYQHMTRLEERYAALKTSGQPLPTGMDEEQKRNDVPEVILLNNELSWHDVIRLYRTCSIYVSPYRSEGFGLMILEAMAAGLPVIVPRAGPALEFTSGESAFYIDVRERVSCLADPCGHMRIFGARTVKQPLWSEPSVDSLARVLVQAVLEKDLLASKALAALRTAQSLEWDAVGRAFLYQLGLFVYMPPSEKPRRYEAGGVLNPSSNFPSSASSSSLLSLLGLS